MRKSFTSSKNLLSAVTGILLLCAGCSFNEANYSRVEKWYVPAQGARPIPCHGSISVWHYHGMMHLSSDGPEWKTDYYCIYFKEPTNSSHDFYLAVSKERVIKESLPVEIRESKGTVQVEGHSVLIDIEYKDANGRWTKPPINGRHKIRIFPDDIR